MRPVTSGEIVIISDSLGQYLKNIPGKHEIKELQKAAILSTAHILREVLMWRNKGFIVGNNVTCGTDCKYRTAATLYIL